MKKIKSSLSEMSLKNNKKYNKNSEELNISIYLPIKFKEGIHANYLFLIIKEKAIIEFVPLASNCKIYHIKKSKLTSFSIKHEVIKNYIDLNSKTSYYI